jgi:hypothetical protein
MDYDIHLSSWSLSLTTRLYFPHHFIIGIIGKVFCLLVHNYMTTYQKIQTFVKQANPSWGKLLKQFQAEQKLLQVIRSSLPPSQSEHCVFVTYNKDTLYLYCDSPTWSAKLRYQSERLLATVQQNSGTTFSKMVCKTTVSSSASEKDSNTKQQRHMELPPQAAQQLRILAESLEDADLSAALQRLSRRSKL